MHKQAAIITMKYRKKENKKNLTLKHNSKVIWSWVLNYIIYLKWISTYIPIWTPKWKGPSFQRNAIPAELKTSGKFTICSIFFPKWVIYLFIQVRKYEPTSFLRDNFVGHAMQRSGRLFELLGWTGLEMFHHRDLPKQPHYWASDSFCSYCSGLSYTCLETLRRQWQRQDQSGWRFLPKLHRHISLFLHSCGETNQVVLYAGAYVYALCRRMILCQDWQKHLPL